MSAPTTTRPADLTARSHWPDPSPAALAWMGNVLGDPGQQLHRIPKWRLAVDGWMYAACGARARIWMTPSPIDADERHRCTRCNLRAFT